MCVVTRIIILLYTNVFLCNSSFDRRRTFKGRVAFITIFSPINTHIVADFNVSDFLNLSDLRTLLLLLQLSIMIDCPLKDKNLVAYFQLFSSIVHRSYCTQII